MIISKKYLDMEEWKIYNSLNSKKGIISGSTLKDDSCSLDFSLATHTGESLDKILENRKLFSSKIDSGLSYISFLQIHSDIVIDVSDFKLSRGWNYSSIKADGIVTNKEGVVLNILTADCLAILAYDEESRVIGAAHAGWRGTKDDIAVKLIEKMEKLGAKKESINVVLSPSIRGCCYEVGEDVAKYFFDYKEALVKTKKDKWHLDIAKVNLDILLKFGIKKNIEISSICTSCSSDSYFSYRKESGCSGRFISFIAMV